MNERSYMALSVLAGAVVGGLAGFLFFTDRGRRLRAEVQPHLADLLTEARKLRAVVTGVKGSPRDLKDLDDLGGLGDDLGEQSPPWPGTAERVPSH